jgi:hypothetical protein
MSISAYKVMEIKTQPEESFNLWHDEWICDHIPEVYAGLNMDGAGLIFIPRQSILAAVEYLKIEKTLTDTEKAKYQIILDKMLQDTGDNDSCQYYCY